MDSPFARIEVSTRESNLRDHCVAKGARGFLELPVLGSEEIQVYRMHSRTNVNIPRDDIKDWSEHIFSDSIIQTSILQVEDFFSTEVSDLKPCFGIEVSFKPGVTDNVGNSATEILSIYSDFAKKNEIKVYSSTLTLLYGNLSRAQAETIGHELLGNSLIQKIVVLSFNELQTNNRFSEVLVPEVKLESNPKIYEMDLHLEDYRLKRLNKKNCWALSIEELKGIRNYFDKEKITSLRKSEDISSNPTDVEMEILAQTWSEHCKHKIFSAEIEYSESEESSYVSLSDKKIHSLYHTYIQGATAKIKKDRQLDWLISVFSDNAGIVRFDPFVDICVKVETHNSPSALDPYGGALTGIVGVNRDILGCGLGARPIANTNVFCLAPPDWPKNRKELPSGLKHPRNILEGVHRGVADGGNKSGIPTVNGAFSFHKNFSGKPLVFCGTIGVIPQETNSGTPTSQKSHKVGDRIVMAGGCIGKDGIHGATFSSMKLNRNAPATAVQIGDPITQKRLADFLLEARDRELFSNITDNGAGGLSSSVGEMATVTNGATIDVALAPVKYPGLSPFELVISESQERMTFAVPEEKLAAFMDLAKKRNVIATDLGHFSNDGFFRVKYKEKTVALLEMDFLHHGLPKMKLHARWEGPRKEFSPFHRNPKSLVSKQELNSRFFLEKALYKILSDWTVRSKEDLVRRYDHEVQAATLVKPFLGKNGTGPGDAAVIWMAPHGGEKMGGISIGCGLAPKYSSYDTYTMAQYALDEAIRNCVSVGGNPDQIALIDNFCWPDPLPSSNNPDAAHKLAQLVRACNGLYDAACIYGTPFISGKDSMKNDYVGYSRFSKEIKISVPPTVLITAVAKVENVSKTVTSDFKNPGDLIFILGTNHRHLGGSMLKEIFKLPKDFYRNELPPIHPTLNRDVYKKLHSAMEKSLLNSCHDCSEGGLLVALAESAIGGELGVRAELDECREILESLSISEFFYNESSGRFIVSVSPENKESFEKHFEAIPCVAFGTTTEAEILRICNTSLVILDAPLEKLKNAWKGLPGDYEA